MNILNNVHLKPVCIVDQETPLKFFFKQIEDAKNTALEEIEVIETKVRGEMDKAWENIHHYLGDKGLLPSDFSKEKYRVLLMEGVIYVIDKTKDGEAIEPV